MNKRHANKRKINKKNENKKTASHHYLDDDTVSNALNKDDQEKAETQNELENPPNINESDDQIMNNDENDKDEEPESIDLSSLRQDTLNAIADERKIRKKVKSIDKNRRKKMVEGRMKQSEKLKKKKNQKNF